MRSKSETEETERGSTGGGAGEDLGSWRRVEKLGCPMTCRFRSSRIGVALFSLVLLAAPAALAGELPPIRTSETNKVVACATPGRLMAYVKERNPNLNA